MAEIPFLNDTDYNFTTVKNICLETVPVLPVGYGMSERGNAVIYKGKPHFWDGLAWQTWGDVGVQFRFNIPPLLTPDPVVEWEIGNLLPVGYYDVNVYVGFIELDFNNTPANVGTLQQLFIHDVDKMPTADYVDIGGSHYLVYNQPGVGDYKLINRHLQGSRIIKLRDVPDNKFKIKATFPNHLGGNVDIDGGYIHATFLGTTI